MNKKKLKKQFKLNPPAMGVYEIRNLTSEKVFIGSTTNLEGILNRHKFELNMGGHRNKTLQTDWNVFGHDKFSFEIVEELFQRENPDYDYRDDLECLEDLWLEKTEPYGEKGYNEKKMTSGERLQMISEQRLKRETVKG